MEENIRENLYDLEIDKYLFPKQYMKSMDHKIKTDKEDFNKFSIFLFFKRYLIKLKGTQYSRQNIGKTGK